MNNIKREFLAGNPIFIYIGINLLAFVLVNLFFRNEAVSYLGFFGSPAIWIMKPYTLLTYIVVEHNMISLIVNALWLYWIGTLLLDFIKSRQFHFIYIGGAMIGALAFSALCAIPGFAPENNVLIGAYTALIAIFLAIATLVPDYGINIMIFGMVRIKFIVAFYVAIDLITAFNTHPTLALAHLAAGLFGFGYIKLLQNGTDLASMFKKKPKLKVYRNSAPKNAGTSFNQKEIDAILDKISNSGYDQLSKAEKETLFRASKDQ